jgi:hypothetical protein
VHSAASRNHLGQAAMATFSTAYRDRLSNW